MKALLNRLPTRVQSFSAAAASLAIHGVIVALVLVAAPWRQHNRSPASDVMIVALRIVASDPESAEAPVEEGAVQLARSTRDARDEPPRAPPSLAGTPDVAPARSAEPVDAPALVEARVPGMVTAALLDAALTPKPPAPAMAPSVATAPPRALSPGPVADVAALAESSAGDEPPAGAVAGAEAPQAPQAPTSDLPPGYVERLLAWLERHKQYPARARRAGEEGTAVVEFSLDPTGRVLARRLVRSTGSDDLDQEALALIERASPLPAPSRQATFVAPLVFVLQ
jgi:protein TonB